MSIRTTSGRWRRVSRTAASPSAASATTSMSGCASRIIRNPARTRAWSSAMTTRRRGPVTAFRLGRPSAVRAAATPGPRTHRRAGDRPRADRRRATRARASRPGPDRCPSPSAVAGPVVEDLHPELIGLPAQPDERRRLTRVAERVGQGLLDDPVDRRVERRRHGPRRTVHLERRRQDRPRGPGRRGSAARRSRAAARSRPPRRRRSARRGTAEARPSRRARPTRPRASTARPGRATSAGPGGPHRPG